MTTTPKKTSPPDLTVIVPAFNEEKSLPGLFEDLSSALEKTGSAWEALFVDDGSTDGTFDVMRGLHEKNPSRVRILRLRRRFGKAAALTAAFREARGRIIATMDADGQDRPENIEKMLAAIEDGADFVCGWRRKRKDSFFKNASSGLYNRAARILTGTRLHDINCGLKTFRREVVEDLELTGDLHRIVPLMAAWKGFRVTEVEVEHEKRKTGKTKYGLMKSPHGLLDLAMFAVLSRYSKRPGHLLGALGALMLIAGLAILGFFIGIKISGGTVAPRYPLFVLGVLLVVTGVQMILAGFITETINYNLSARAEFSVAEKLEKDEK